MGNYCGNYENKSCININCISECDKYKEKSSELCLKAQYIQEEAKKFMCEARELDAQSKEYQYKAKELCAQANAAYENAQKLNYEFENLLDLASFYCNKATECYKNTNSLCGCKPSCNTHCK